MCIESTTSSFTLLKITTAANTTKDTVSMSNFAFLSSFKGCLNHSLEIYNYNLFGKNNVNVLHGKILKT